MAAEADKAATARGPAIPEAKSLIRARDGGAGRATRRPGAVSRRDGLSGATARPAERRANELVTSPEGSPARFRGAARRSIPGEA